MTRVLDHALAEIAANGRHPAPVSGPRRTPDGHRVVKGLPISPVPPNHGVEIYSSVGADCLTNGQEAVGEDVVEVCDPSDWHLPLRNPTH